MDESDQSVRTPYTPTHNQQQWQLESIHPSIF